MNHVLRKAEIDKLVEHFNGRLKVIYTVSREKHEDPVLKEEFRQKN